MRTVAGVLIGAGIVGLFWLANPSTVTVELPACVKEDSADCYWDGGSNGVGREFIDYNGDVYYRDGE